MAAPGNNKLTFASAVLEADELAAELRNKADALGAMATFLKCKGDMAGALALADEKLQTAELLALHAPLTRLRVREILNFTESAHRAIATESKLMKRMTPSALNMLSSGDEHEKALGFAIGDLADDIRMLDERGEELVKAVCALKDLVNNYPGWLWSWWGWRAEVEKLASGLDFQLMRMRINAAVRTVKNCSSDALAAVEASHAAYAAAASAAVAESAAARAAFLAACGTAAAPAAPPVAAQ